jgi:probable F420-dependent oxidoreductase
LTLNFSFELPTHRVDAPEEFVTGDAVGELAAAAEKSRFAACHVTDHPAPDAKWLDHGGHHALDPFVALSFAAAATRAIKVMTHVLIPAYRNPFLLAKSVQSIDVLSGGRFVLGAGAGYLKPEFAALGVEFDERNDLFDESIEVLTAVLGGGDTAYTGRHFAARGVRLAPPTVARPRPPIWVGGNSLRAIERAVRYCEGWAPFGTAGYAAASRTADISEPDDLAVRIGKAKAMADEVRSDRFQQPRVSPAS